MKTLQVVIKKPGEFAYIAQMSGDLKTMQAMVGGYIQYLPGDSLGLRTGIDMYSNEEAKIVGLEPNVWIFDRQDQIWGTFFFVGANEETGENRSLTVEEAALVLAWCAQEGRAV